MDSSVCTLFEGDYHYGVGALVNSLYAHGFRGAVWAGYRNHLPSWAKPLKVEPSYKEYTVADGCCIRFVELTTTHHFTNYKPDFMLHLWQNFCPQSEALFYFDPDIVIKCGWSFFEEWASYGIALCEDVNSPVSANHPLRGAWRKFYGEHGIVLGNQNEMYFNGGFVGISREMTRFLAHWKRAQELMSPVIGGLQNHNVGDRTFPFYKTDQDALNATVMFSEFPIAPMGKEGMDFIPGGYTMSHAIGPQKPWKKKMLREAISGVPPSTADKGYWQNVLEPIRLYSSYRYGRKRIALRIGSAIGRFMSRR